LEQSNATLFEALLASSDGRGTSNQAVNGHNTPLCGKVDRYLAMGVAVSQSFIDVVQWWIGRKDVLPAHGNGLPGDSRNINTISSSELHVGVGVYISKTITII
jgi:hypothetical protein